MLVKVVFLDRDGVINEQAPPHQYITKWEDIRYLPGVYDGIRELNKAGLKVIIISNQRCIARGLATINEVEMLNRQLHEDLKKHRCVIDAMYYCPHDMKDNCECRKPKTGMLERAEKDLKELGFQLDKKNSWIIGDFWSDVQTGINYGINTMKVESRGEDTSEPVSIIDDGLRHMVALNFLDAVKTILTQYNEINVGVDCS